MDESIQKYYLNRFMFGTIPGMGQGDSRIRLRDVAERAGVSVGSASQAFGRPDLVSDQVRERVLAAADALGYPGRTLRRVACEPDARAPWA